MTALKDDLLPCAAESFELSVDMREDFEHFVGGKTNDRLNFQFCLHFQSDRLNVFGGDIVTSNPVTSVVKCWEGDIFVNVAEEALPRQVEAIRNRFIIATHSTPAHIQVGLTTLEYQIFDQIHSERIKYWVWIIKT